MKNKPKTNLSIFFEEESITRLGLTELIRNHNNGISLKLLNDIISFLNDLKNKVFPLSLKNMRIELIESEGRINVFENGEKLSYSIQEMEYYTLADTIGVSKSKKIAGPDALMLEENPIFHIHTNK